MTPALSSRLNALGLFVLSAVLIVIFADQLLYDDLPCPLCLLQRAGLVAAGFGIALNLVFGTRPSHYGLAILGAIAGACVSVRQILLHVSPGTGSYGNALLGLHFYTWALLIFVAIVIGSAVMLLFDDGFVPGEANAADVVRPPIVSLAGAAFLLFFLLVLANMLLTVAECGAGLCPENPSGYLLFNEDIQLT